MLATPFITAAANRLGPFDLSDTEVANGGSRCVQCGVVPALAILRRDDGKRLLVCALCAHAWPYPRISCPYCGETEQGQLGVLFLRKEDPWWIETCQTCGHYIKCFDERRLPEDQSWNPYVAETATLHLDLIAENENLVRGQTLLAAT
jgi:FdhE protein